MGIFRGDQSLIARIAELEAENIEQARLLGMSGSREAKLLAELAAARVDAERYRELRRAVAMSIMPPDSGSNISVRSVSPSLDVPDEIDRVVDAAIAARGAA